MRISQRNTVVEWVDLVCAELGVGRDEADRRAVLDLARCVARDVGSAAVPLTFFLLGLAVGRGLGQAEACSRVSTLVERLRGPDWRD